MSDLHPRFADFVRRYFSIKAGEPVSVLPDIMPVANVMEEAWELRAYRNERRWTAWYTVAAGGLGNYGRITFGNLAGSNRLIIVERIAAYKNAAQIVSSAIIPPIALSLQTSLATPLDPRAWPGGSPANVATELWFVTATPAAMPSLTQRIDHFYTTAGSIPVWSPYFPPVILNPGGPQLCVVNQTANEELNVQLLCYDVPLHGNEEV